MIDKVWIFDQSVISRSVFMKQFRATRIKGKKRRDANYAVDLWVSPLRNLTYWTQG